MLFRSRFRHIFLSYMKLDFAFFFSVVEYGFLFCGCAFFSSFLSSAFFIAVLFFFFFHCIHLSNSETTRTAVALVVSIFNVYDNVFSCTPLLLKIICATTSPLFGREKHEVIHYTIVKRVKKEDACFSART